MTSRKLFVKAWGEHGDTEQVDLEGIFKFAGEHDYLAEARSLSTLSRLRFIDRLVHLSLFYDKMVLRDSLLGGVIEANSEIIQYLIDEGILHIIRPIYLDEHFEYLKKESLKKADSLAEEILTLGRGFESIDAAAVDVAKAGGSDAFIASLKKHLREKLEDAASAWVHDAELTYIRTEFGIRRAGLLQKYGLLEREEMYREKEAIRWNVYVQRRISTLSEEVTRGANSTAVELSRIFFDEAFPEFLPHSASDLDKVRNSSALVDFRSMLSDKHSPGFLLDRQLLRATKLALRQQRVNEVRMLRVLNWASALGGFGVGFFNPVVGLLTPVFMEYIGRKVIHRRTVNEYKWAFLFVDNLNVS
jgi:hypothetical protein